MFFLKVFPVSVSSFFSQESDSHALIVHCLKACQDLCPVTHPERSQYPVVVLGVLLHPGVAVVDVGLIDVLVHNLWHDHKPLRQEVSLQNDGECSECKTTAIDQGTNSVVCADMSVWSLNSTA